MLNKKNIAIAMTAATAVSAFAPMTTAFAAVVENTQEAEIKAIKEKVYQLYQAKYTNDVNLLLVDTNAGICPYTIKVSDENGENLTAYSNYADFEKALNEVLAKVKQDTNKVIIEYTNNGRKLDDGQIIDAKEIKYTNEITSETVGTKVVDDATDIVGNVKYDTLVDGTKVAKIRISDDTSTGERRYVTVKAGDVKLDLSKAIYRQVNGYFVDKNGNSIEKVPANKVPGAITVSKGVIDGYYIDAKIAVDVADREVEKDVIVKSKTTITNKDYKVSDLYEKSTGRYTTEGNELVKLIQKQLNDSPDLKDVEAYVVKTNGDEIKYDAPNAFDGIRDASTVKNLKLVFQERAKTADKFETVGTVTITGERNASIIDIISKVDDIVASTPVAATNIDVRAGLNRYETAVEASKAGWTNALVGKSGEKAVVLVSGDQKSLVDGLAATPLAASLNDTNEGAPVLLTQKDEVPQVVLDEMKRLGANKVYIVGGESVVSDELENKLQKTYGYGVERIAGKDRYSTSLAVAEKLQDVKGGAKFTDVFVVGGHGEADALSASAVAGIKKSPILLTKSNELTAELKYFLKGNVVDADNDKDVFVVGGNTVVANEVQDEIVSNGLEVQRLAGERRQDTNAAVISRFEDAGALGSAVQTVIMAKSDNKGMVDALAAGALGAKKNAHIVLATEELTYKQEDAIKKVDAEIVNKAYQVGYGVLESVAKFVKGLL